jgi:outer membrane protein TolC
MKIAAMVLVSALLGAGGVVVKDQVQEAREQEILLAEVEGNLRLAEMEMDLVVTQYEQVEDRYQAGIVSQEAILSARLSVLKAETHHSRLQLDEEEIRATGRAPRDELSAPLVGGRDLVTERLELDRSVAMEELAVAEAQLARIQERYEAGVVGNPELMEAMIPVQRAEARLQGLDRRLELRRQVLDGAITGPEAERQVEMSQLREEMEVLEQAWESAATRLRRTEEWVSHGIVQESELVEARHQLLQLETRMEVLRMKLDVLEEGGSGTGGDG